MEDYADYSETVDEEESEDFGDYDQSSNEFDLDLISILATISTWFIRIGMAIGVILFIYFIVTGKIITALLYIIGLVVAFFFGYGFMFCLDHFVENE